MKQALKYNFEITVKFIKIIHRISKSYLPLTLLSIVLSSSISFVNIIFPKYIIDELLGARNSSRIIMFVILTIGTNFLFNLVTHIISYYFEIQNEKVTAKLDIILGEKSLELDFDQVEQSDNLELKERAMFVIHNQNALGRMLLSLRSIVQNIITIIGLVAIIATLNFFVILFIMLILFLSSKIFQKQNQSMFLTNQELIPINRIFSYYSALTTDFSAGKDIRIYNMQPLILRKIDEFISKNLSILAKLSNDQQKYQALGSVNLNIENICIYIYMCYRVYINSITIGDFTMYINAINNFGSAISGLISQFFEFSNMCQYLDPFFKFLEIPPKSTDGTHMMEIDPSNFEIQFDHVSFSYPNTQKLALDDICVTIRSNERISVVGMNGAGKTTFIKLLTRLYRPVSGTIRINGIDINEFQYKEYIKFFSAVFQDYKNYAFTIKENIALDKTDQISAEKIHNILCELSLDEKISDLEKGINTSLYKIFDENGIEFSGGEMQKIAIARAIFKNAAIVFLDEPTSALDPVTEYEIMNSFNNIIQDKTAIYISHRLSSCRFSDRILVMNGGKIEEDGTHTELMQNKNGLYYKMFNSQAQYYV